MTTAPKSAAPNLRRGMTILEHLATQQRSATIAELVECLGYPSASVFRITRELAELGYLSRDSATKRFTLTNKFLRLGQPGGRERGFVEASLAALLGLHKTTGETTQLCCLVDGEVVVLEQLISTHPFKYSADLGARCPAHSCAPGKAIIANLPDDRRAELVGRMHLKRFTATTITDRREFRRELATVATLGYAVDRSEGMEGIRCIAAAICDRHRIPVGAITIAAPASRLLDDDIARLGVVVVEAARAAELKYCQ